MAAFQQLNRTHKKSVDHQIPLVPFIDLLLCCIMFLLATAVWSELQSVSVTQQTEAGPLPLESPAEQPLLVEINNTGFVLREGAGILLTLESRSGKEALSKLRTELALFRFSTNRSRRIIIRPEDNVPYERVIHTMDAVGVAGFSDMSVSH